MFMNIEIKLEITIGQFWSIGVIPVIHEDTFIACNFIILISE